MPRNFTASGTGDKITTSLGAAASITGAVTLAVILKSSADGVARGVLNVGSAGASTRSLRTTTGNAIQLRSNNAQTGSTSIVASDGWCFVCYTKAAGTATPRGHKYVYGTNTWTHTDAAATLGDSTPTTSSIIGANGGNNSSWTGDIAICGAYAAALTDAQVESMAYGLPPWWQVAPNGLWILDQSATAMLVNDLTGGGANQTAITGTAVGTSPVPVFSYGAPVG